MQQKKKKKKKCCLHVVEMAFQLTKKKIEMALLLNQNRGL